MQKVMIVGKDQQSMDHIDVELQGLLEAYPEVSVSMTHPYFLETLVDGAIDILIFDIAEINRKIFSFVRQLRKMGVRCPVIFLGKCDFDISTAKLNSAYQVYCLERSYKEGELVALAKSCMNIAMLQTRPDYSFEVSEHAILESYDSDFKAKTTIANISKKGLRIHGSLKGLKPGDFLRLNVIFDELNKERTLSARVRWVRRRDNQEHAALDFVKESAVYEHLLDNVAA